MLFLLAGCLLGPPRTWAADHLYDEAEVALLRELDALAERRERRDAVRPGAGLLGGPPGRPDVGVPAAGT